MRDAIPYPGGTPVSYQIEKLQKACPLLKVEEVSTSGRTGLVGRKLNGEVVIRVGGEINRRLTDKFQTEYLRAVAAGIIKREVPA